MTRAEILDYIEEKKLIAVVRLDDTSDLLKVSEALLKGGVSILEVTMTIPGAIEGVRELRREMGDDVLVGMGSVLDPETATRAIDAGSRFIVSPIMRPSLVKAAHDGGVPVSLGAYTPTEILEATDAGSDVVKVFPSNQLGPGYIKAVRAPMPHLKLLPTGGVDAGNIEQWLEVGVFGMACGSSLVDMKAVRAGKFDVLTENARELTGAVERFNNNRKQQG